MVGGGDGAPEPFNATSSSSCNSSGGSEPDVLRPPPRQSHRPRLRQAVSCDLHSRHAHTSHLPSGLPGGGCLPGSHRSPRNVCKDKRQSLAGGLDQPHRREVFALAISKDLKAYGRCPPTDLLTMFEAGRGQRHHAGKVTQTTTQTC